jgi:hypothetical protein
VQALGELLATGRAVPFLVRVVLDLALNEEVRELSALRFALEGHGDGTVAERSRRLKQREEVDVSDDRQTCGKGLAANAVLPEALGELMSTRAEVLERHTRALDPSNAIARSEREVYVRLARAHREVAGALGRLAADMAACRDLPMAPHDMAAMIDPNGQREAFARFIASERKLAQLLEAQLEQEERPQHARRSRG